jgi:hypothetical protein
VAPDNFWRASLIAIFAGLDVNATSGRTGFRVPPNEWQGLDTSVDAALALGSPGARTMTMRRPSNNPCGGREE